MYNVGDNIITDTKNITITDVSKKKQSDGSNKTVYKYRCNICGFDCNNIYHEGDYLEELWSTSTQLIRNKHCSCCSSKVVKSDINSIAITHSYLTSYFMDEQDAYKYTYLSNKIVIMKCPYCGEEKCMRISDLYNQGFACPRCSDGLPIGERIMYIILRENDIDFIKEYEFSNTRYKYDFYIKDFNMIIETNGKQHYEETKISRGTKCLEDEIQNDKNKMNLALENGIEKYIYIDCKKSDVDYIIDSIHDSGILDILCIENINRHSIREALYSHSITKDICDIYNLYDDVSIKYISDMLHFDRTTIRKHLKIGASLGWCDYNVETYKSSKRFKSKRVYIDAA